MGRWIVAALLSGMLARALAAQPPARDAAEDAAGSCPARPPAPAYYVPSQVDLIGLNMPPPAAGSREQQDDLQVVLAAQRAAHANGTLERALADSEMTCARFKDVLGPEQIGRAHV